MALTIMSLGGVPIASTAAIRPKPIDDGLTVMSPTSLTPPISAKSGYAQVPDYMDLAKQYLPKPEPLKPLTSFPEYQQTKLDTNIQNRPEYQQALTWNLPTAPRIDPQTYEDRWRSSARSISDAFYRPGGAYETGLNPILERGLGSSGDRERVAGDLGDKLARALAEARLGLDVERSQQENAINQMVYGTTASRNQSISDAAKNLLGQRLGFEGANTATAQNLLNLQATRDQYESQLPFQYGQSVLGAATGLTNQQNQLVSQVFEQEMQNKQLELQKIMQAREAEERMRQQRLEEMMSIFGEVNYGDEEERFLANQYLQGTGLPTLDKADFNLPIQSSARQGEVAQYLNRPSLGGMGSPYLPSTPPPFPGAFVGEKVGKWAWSGAGWNKQAGYA